MIVIELLALLVVACGGTAVALIRVPVHQVIALSFFGLSLAVLFVVLQAPEVALSELAVGAVIVPLLYMAAIVRTMRRTR